MVLVSLNLSVAQCLAPFTMILFSVTGDGGWRETTA